MTMSLGITVRRKRGRPRIHEDEVFSEAIRLDQTSMKRGVICKRLGISYPTLWRRLGRRAEREEW